MPVFQQASDIIYWYAIMAPLAGHSYFVHFYDLRIKYFNYKEGFYHIGEHHLHAVSHNSYTLW
jgi:hypothetical protein